MSVEFQNSNSSFFLFCCLKNELFYEPNAIHTNEKNLKQTNEQSNSNWRVGLGARSLSQGLNFIVTYSIKRSQVFKILHVEHGEFQIFI